jgi:hypothetical protein
VRSSFSFFGVNDRVAFDRFLVLSGIMSGFFVSSIVYKLLLLALIVAAYLRLRGQPKKELKFALVWLLILLVLLLGYSLLH